MAADGYGALDDEKGEEAKKTKQIRVVEADGWPNCDRLSNLYGSRQGVLLSCGLQEMQRALALSAVVSTLPVALFGEGRQTDPSRPWLDTCVDNDDCSFSPTRLVTVQMMALVGALVGIPFAGYACDALGFPYVVTFGAVLQPLVMQGYAAVGLSRITVALFALRVMHGVDNTANEVGGLAALSVSWTPASASTAFGWRMASHSVVGTVAPLIIAALHWRLGSVGAMFTAVACSGSAAAACAVFLVAVPWLHDPSLRLNPTRKALQGEDEDVSDLEGKVGAVPEMEAEVEIGAQTRGVAKNSADVASAADSPASAAADVRGRGDEGVWLLLIAVAVGVAECLIEGVVMMHLSGVMGYSHGACAWYLALFNVPNAAVMLSADLFLRRVLPWVSMSAGLASSAAAVLGLAWLGANKHDCVGASERESGGSEGEGRQDTWGSGGPVSSLARALCGGEGEGAERGMVATTALLFGVGVAMVRRGGGGDGVAGEPRP